MSSTIKISLSIIVFLQTTLNLILLQDLAIPHPLLDNQDNILHLLKTPLHNQIQLIVPCHVIHYMIINQINILSFEIIYQRLKHPSYLQDYECVICKIIWRIQVNTTYEPEYFHQAIKHDYRKRSMEEELASLEENQTWIFVPLRSTNKAIDCIWIYKVKFNSYATLDRYKSNLISKGYTQ